MLTTETTRREYQGVAKELASAAYDLLARSLELKDGKVLFANDEATMTDYVEKIRRMRSEIRLFFTEI